LAAEGWSLRGTTREPARIADIDAVGIEPAVADPDRPGTVLELVGDVTVVHWLLGTAEAEPEGISAIHGPRLEALLEKLVDTPVRGFVYEAAGGVPRRHLERGTAIVRSAAQTWRIPVEVVEADPADRDAWLDAMTSATQHLVS
jgi:hypothetical protein